MPRLGSLKYRKEEEASLDVLKQPKSLEDMSLRKELSLPMDPE